MLKVYNNQNVGQAQLSAPQMRNISTGGVAGLMPTDTIKAGQKVMGAIFDAMAERQRVQDNTDLAAAASELQKQAIAYESQYRQQNMGRDARNAGDDWARNVGDLAGKISEQFQGRPELQQRFKVAARELAMRSYASGFTYADQQENAYRDATKTEKFELLKKAIGTGSPMDIAAAKQDYESTLALLYPGANLQPELMAVDRVVAGGLIDRALAEGDIREARALYKEQRDQLGKDAPSYLSKINAKQEALEKKWEAEKKVAEFKAATDKVTTILDSAEDEKSALEQVEKLAGDDAEKRDLFMKAWDAVTKQRKDDAARKQAAEDNAFFTGLDERVKDMSAQELTGYVLGLTDPDHQKGAKLAWERQHGQAPVVLVSDSVHLQQVYDDVAKGQKSVDRILLEHDGHISDEDAAKVRQAVAKAGAKKVEAAEKLKVELQTKTDIRNEYLNILGLGGKKLTEKQMGQKASFLLQAQDALTRKAQSLGRELTNKEQREVYDSLIVVSKDRFFGADERAYENPEPEPTRPASLPDSAVWLPKRVPASNKPGDKSTKVIWTWQYPDGSYVPETLLKKIKGEMNG